MPVNSQTKKSKPQNSAKETSTPAEPPLSFSSYPAIVGVHGSLLIFSALFVPQSKSYLELATQLPGAVEFTSLDHPQHPFLIPITVNPLLTLTTLCASAVLLQSWWSGWLKNWHWNSTIQGSEEDVRLNKAILRKSKANALLRAWTATLLSSGIFHVVFVLFGAPFTSHMLHTYLLALLFSILVIFPSAYVLGTPSLTSSSTQALVVRLTWTRVFAEMSIEQAAERALLYSSAGAALGCWVGVFPIALDWDRPWQAWPLTPAYGIVFGYVCGSIASLFMTSILHLAQHGRRLAQEDS